MAISFVEGLTGSAANGSNVTINFVNAEDGDLALVIGGHNSTGVSAGVLTAGYTLAVETGANVRMAISYKILSGDTSVQCNGSGDSDDGEAFVVMVFRGVDSGTPIDVATPDPASGSSGEPNSGPITTATDGAAVISCFLVNEVDGFVLGGPSGYNDYTTVTGSDVNDVRAGAAWVAVDPAGTENPGPWDFSESPGESWRAGIVALRPADEGTFGDGALSGGSIRGTASFVGGTFDAGRFSATGTGTATLKGNALTSRVGAFTGTGTASFVGISLASAGVLAATGTGTMSMGGGIDGSGDLATGLETTTLFVGTVDGDGAIETTSEWNVFWVGAISRMSSVRETIESRGAATVGIS
jgi:hypothetical protein